MKLFALDLHISVIADIKDILKDHEITEWSLSGHNWVFGRQPANPDVINRSNWKELTPDRIRAFQDRYDSFLSQFDGFIVGYATSYCMLYEKYDKPIFGVTACRYDIPFCVTKDKETREQYHTCLQRMLEKKQLHIVANNKADQEYFRLGTGFTIPILPSLCRYTGMKHNPVHPTFMWYSDAVDMPKHPLITARPEVFEWSDLCTYRGIIHLPYEVSTMSMYEQYQAGIPMFLPSKILLKMLWKTGSRWQSTSPYWDGQEPPELEPTRSMQFWIDRADFYDSDNMRGIYFYETFYDLFKMLQNFTDPLRSERLAWIAERETKTVEAWNTIVNQSS